MAGKHPHLLTLLHRRYYSGLVIECIGEGPKFYRGQAVREDEDAPGGISRGEVYKYAKADYLAVPGARRDLITKTWEARRAYDAAHEAWQRGFEDAIAEAKGRAREAYDRDHPYPTLPPVEELIR